MLIVNLKAYRGAAGERGEELRERIEAAAERAEARIVVAPQPADMHRYRNGPAEVFSQHVDPVEPGSHTGSVLAESASPLAEGTLLNHSERRMERERIERALERCREAGLETVVCSPSPEECAELSALGPDFVAFEPPELIGGKTSVSEAEPELIEEAVERSEVPVLTGAGIKSAEDVRRSVEQGAEGVLVASGVVKAENPREEILELCSGLEG